MGSSVSGNRVIRVVIIPPIVPFSITTSLFTIPVFNSGRLEVDVGELTPDLSFE